MKDKEFNQNAEVEIDLSRLVGALLNKAWLIGIVSVLCALLSFLGTFFFVTPLYQSSAMFYVNNNSLSLGEASLSISSADISASRGLVKSYIVILETRETLNDVIDYSGVNRSYGQLRGMISAESVNSTEIFRVTVTSPDPQEAEQIASAIAYVLPKRISSIIEGTSAKIVDSAVVPSSPSSPSYSRNMTMGFVMGFVASAAIIILWVLLDITIRSEEDITQNCRYPLLASVPDMTVVGKGGYNYSYDRKKKLPTNAAKQPVLIGTGMSFVAAESYKLLRTKLQFAFADEKTSHVIAVSSALSGEGKSLTAINLAYSLAQLGKKVVLIDCDMRRPTMAEKLNLQKNPGLSNFLTGQNGLEEMIQFCGIKDDEDAFHVITAGQNPPNPIELLSSEKMSKMLTGLRRICDYVILDLPPAEEVSDALAVAKDTDGVLLVVRQNRCDRVIMKDTVRQFEFVGAKILGVVYNCATEGNSGYGKKYYRNYYYRRYYRRNYYYRSNERESQGGKYNARGK